MGSSSPKTSPTYQPNEAAIASGGRRNSKTLSQRIGGSLRGPSSSGLQECVGPTVEEVMLAARLAERGMSPVAAEAPPFYAVDATWLLAWQKFAAGTASSPGPIVNRTLVEGGADGANARDGAVTWLTGDDWHMLHSRHGGGPVLRRASRALFPPCQAPQLALPEESSSFSQSSLPSRPSVANTVSVHSNAAEMSDSEVLARRGAAFLTSRCKGLEKELAEEVVRVQQTVWGSGRASKLIQAARARVLQAAGVTKGTGRNSITTAGGLACGGEELKEALRALRALGDSDAIGRLETMVNELCANEEAQITMACIIQALHDSDRLGLELWLEQADAMGLDTLTAGHGQAATPLVATLRKHRADLEERELRALKGHGGSEETPDEILWRQAVIALEDDDEATLSDLIADAERHDIDASSVKLALEELLRRRTLADLSDARVTAAREEEARAARERAERASRQAEEDLRRSRERAQQRENEWRDWRDAAERERQRQRTSDAQEERRRRGERQSRDRQDEDSRRRDSYTPPAPMVFGEERRQALASLGLPPGPVPPMAELKAAYRTAAMRSHPDRPQNRNRQQEATAEFQRVKAAFDLLAPGA